MRCELCFSRIDTDQPHDVVKRDGMVVAREHVGCVALFDRMRPRPRSREHAVGIALDFGRLDGEDIKAADPGDAAWAAQMAHLAGEDLIGVGPTLRKMAGV